MAICPKKIKILKDYIWIVLGSLLTALSMNIFLIPFKIAAGGVSGLATVLYYLSMRRLPVGATMLAINVPLFILGFRYIGKSFIIRTLAGTFLLSAMIDSTSWVGNFFLNYLKNSEQLKGAPDLLLYAVVGGFIMGVGLGLVLKSGATTGGTELAAALLNNLFKSLTVGKWLFFIDGLIVAFAAIVFNSVVLALYGVVSLYISIKVIDAMLEGIDFAKQVFIISDNSKAIAQRIMVDLDRGVTSLKGTGVYTGTDKDILLCVLEKSEITKLQSIVKEEDKDAFVILNDVREVIGDFRSYE